MNVNNLTTQEKIEYLQAFNNIPITGEMSTLVEASIKNMIGKYPELGILGPALWRKPFKLNDDEMDTLLRTVFNNSNEMELKMKINEANLEMEDEVDEPENIFDMSTDGFTSPYASTYNGYQQHYLSENEYVKNETNKEYIFLHHTAGWDNPFNQIDIWENDSIGRIGTHYVIGGSNIRGNSTNDGIIAQAFPLKYWAYHLGGSNRGIDSYMESHSIGIELCNHGWIKNGLTWAGHTVPDNMAVELEESFRGYKKWHKYTDKQLNQAKSLIISLGNRYSIDIRNQGLIKWIRQGNVNDAFSYKIAATNGQVRGLLSHTNVRRDKFDVSPQPNLIDMLLSI